MNKRSLFVSFAESDGGHSYLATRAMLDANSIGHLIFRTTVSDALDAVTSGQSNFAVVPLYNSITQWEGTTLKALATGQFEIFAQVCTPTSYVLAAHREYMTAIVDRYQQLSDRNEKLSPERAKKIYTRFLTRIFVGSQAEEQYRGRLLRPDMAQASIEHARNPLRVLEEIARNELMNELKTGSTRHPRAPRENGYGTSPILMDYPVRQASISELNVPATLIAAGLLDMQQDPDGWDRHGSVGEIVSLLRNLLELLDVYAFGAPDLPENKTQYVLVGRKGSGIPAGALRLPAGAPPTRVMTMIRSNYRKSSTDQWLKPREKLAKDVKDHGVVLDRAPIMVAGGPSRVFLIEGGKLKGHTKSPAATGTTWFGTSTKKSLREAIESKREPKPKSGSSDDYARLFLGEYHTWCPTHDAGAGDYCSCCDEAFDAVEKKPGFPTTLVKIAVASLVTLGLLLLAYSVFYCSLTGQCATNVKPGGYQPPVVSPQEQHLSPDHPSSKTPAPGSSGTVPLAGKSTHSPNPRVADPGKPLISNPGQANPQQPAEARRPARETTSILKKPVSPSPRDAEVQPIVLHTAFMQAKANLTRESYNTLTSAAAHALQMNRPVSVRIFALGQRENDPELWQRRVNAVKDELVRLGVPFERLRTDGTGPYVVTIKALDAVKPHSARERNNSDLDTVNDPFTNE